MDSGKGTKGRNDVLDRDPDPPMERCSFGDISQPIVKYMVHAVLALQEQITGSRCYLACVLVFNQ